MIALIDITIGGAAIGIGVIAFNRDKFKLALISYVFACTVSFVLAIIGLYAVTVKSMRLVKFYFGWKCMEVCLFPIFELIIIFA